MDKFKTFIQKEKQDLQKKVQKVLSKSSSTNLSPLSPSSASSVESLFPSTLQYKSLSRDPESEIRCHPSDPEQDEQVLNSIDSLYFTTTPTFDPSLHELKKLPNLLDLEYIGKQRTRLRGEILVVSKRVFQLILDKQGSYTSETGRIREIEDELDAALFTCQEARKDLHLTKQEFTIKSLSILANYQKRQAATNLLKSLRTIHTLQRTEVRLQELLSEDDYPGAIGLILECLQAAETYKHFHCISQLSLKLRVTLENAEEQLDMALSKVCSHFEPKHYAKLQRAYELLGKTHTCADQLLMHFGAGIHNTAFSVVHGFAELCRNLDETGGTSNLQKKPYQDLCSCLNPDLFIPCLVDLCKSMWKILNSYHKLLNWHSESRPKPTTPNSIQSDSDDYVDQKLNGGSVKIWQDVQTRIKTFLLACDFSGFKIDDFMSILSIIHTLQKVGTEFCSSDSESLRDCIREASLRYFLTYHCTKLDELRVFLENEGWAVCPVKSDFDIHQLHEFKFLKSCSNSPRPNVFSLNSNPNPSSKESQEESTRGLLFRIYENQGSPFEISKESPEEDIYAIREKAKNSKRKSFEKDGDEVDSSYGGGEGENTDEEESLEDFSIITNTSLTILRLFGRYVHLMHLLKPIAHDVAVRMSQLFEYYFYSIFLFFGTENGEVTIEKISNAQLRVALTRIKNNIIQDSDSTSEIANEKIPPPIVSPVLDLSNPEDLYGLHERVVGSESAVYLALQLDSLKRFIETQIPPSNWDSVAQLIDQAVIVSQGLRRLTFAGVSCRAVDYQAIVNGMERVNWDVRDLMSQHSPYVDLLLRGLQVFAMKVESISRHFVPIPEPVHRIIWELILFFCCRGFVDGFGNAKKCSNSGRGLMQLDFTQFLSKLDSISPVSLKGCPDREYVESYVKAFYMPEPILEQWISTHSEYTSKQLISLVNSALRDNKRAKQRLIGIIEDMDKNRR